MSAASNNAVEGVKNKVLKQNKTFQWKNRTAVRQLEERHRLAEIASLVEGPSKVHEGLIEKDQEWEKTTLINQSKILEHVDLDTAAKKFSLRLERGPYLVDYSLDGRFLLTAGSKGDMYLIDSINNEELCHVYPDEKIRAIKMCYSHSCYAVAQRKYVSLYDQKGMEFQCFKDDLETTALDYLPFHFLLTSLSPTQRTLRWKDLTDGQLVAAVKLQKPSPNALKHNLYNGVTYVGHQDGKASLWIPSANSACMEFFCGHGPVISICPFRDYYVAAGHANGKVRIYDIRNANRAISVIPFHCDGPLSIDASGTGLLALSRGAQTHIIKDAHTSNPSRYLKHSYRNGDHFSSVKFRPYEDILAVGHTGGIETLIIPGSGISSPDSTSLANPYATERERSGALVRSLIDKLPPDTILFDPTQFGLSQPS